MKRILFKIIKYCPFNGIRVFIYRSYFKYEIGKNVYIGNSIISANDVIIGDNVIIKGDSIISCKNLRIGVNTSIHSGNRILGKGSLIIGDNSRIINNHYIDLWNDVKIGNNSWLAGRGSQLWTHGSLQTRKPDKQLSIEIGDNVYIGSSSLIAPGVKIENINLIGLGSVLTRSVDSSRNVIIGNPAKVIKENIDWREHW